MFTTGLIFILFIMLGFHSLLLALFLKIVTRPVAMFYLPYLKALKIAAVALFFTFIVLFPVHYAIDIYSSQENTIMDIAIGIPVFLLIQSITYYYMIIHPEYGQIGLIKSLWISFMLTALSLPFWIAGCPTYDP